MFEYTDYHIAPWGLDLAVYFFLVGTAAMTFVLSVAPNVFAGTAKAFEPARMPGVIVSLVIMAICGPLLVMDLGQPGRFLYPILYFRVTSPLSWGAVLLVLFVLSILVFLYASRAGNQTLVRRMAVIGSLLALTMPIYTGMDLMVNQAREVWQTPMLPVLFVVLSVTSGAAVMAIIAQLVKGVPPEATGLLRQILLGSIGVTLVLFFFQSVQLTFGTAEEQEAWTLINSEYGVRFWLLTFVVGIVAPLIALLVPGLAKNPAVVVASGVAGAIGAYTFREVLLYAGQLPQLGY